MTKILILCVLMGIVACATSPTNRYYLLTPSAGADAPTSPASLPTITVNIPAYLDRPQIVIDRGGGQVDIREFDRWAEPVDSMIQRIVQQDIQAHLFRPDAKHVVDLSIDAFTFRSGQVELRAHWSLTKAVSDNAEKVASPAYFFAQTLPPPSDDVPGLIKAMSTLIDALSQSIVQTL